MDISHKLSGFALKHLPEKQMMTLRSRYFQLRRKLQPLSKLLYGTFSTQELREHLEQTLDPNFEILMVHSSMNRLAPLYTGNPLELVQMLIEFTGPERTLAMPAFWFGDPKIGTVRETIIKNSRLDLRKTPSQMGLATELFRRSKNVMQSRHPVYRVAAIGPLAQQLVAGHELARSPSGSGTPFEFMAERNTLVLGIGKSFHVMTQTHHVEGIMGDEFPVPSVPTDQRKPLIVTVVDGETEVSVTLPGGGLLWNFNIAKLPQLLNDGELAQWKFHNVPFFSAHAGVITASLIAAAKRGETLYDPP